MSDPVAEELRRIREAVEELLALQKAQAVAAAVEPVSYPLGPILPKDRPRGGGRRR